MAGRISGRTSLRSSRPISSGFLAWDPGWTDSFEDRVRRTEGHWLWTGYIDRKDGYGRFKPHHNMRAELAHRVAYVRWIGPIPDDHVIDHRGHPFTLRRCVRPECLEAITHEENIRRGNSPAGRNARLTHCPKCGNEYNELNTVFRSSGERRCRICRQAAKRAARTASAPGSRSSPHQATDA